MEEGTLSEALLKSPLFRLMDGDWEDSYVLAPHEELGDEPRRDINPTGSPAIVCTRCHKTRKTIRIVAGRRMWVPIPRRARAKADPEAEDSPEFEIELDGCDCDAEEELIRLSRSGRYERDSQGGSFSGTFSDLWDREDPERPWANAVRFVDPEYDTLIDSAEMTGPVHLAAVAELREWEHSVLIGRFPFDGIVLYGGRREDRKRICHAFRNMLIEAEEPVVYLDFLRAADGSVPLVGLFPLIWQSKWVIADGLSRESAGMNGAARDLFSEAVMRKLEGGSPVMLSIPERELSCLGLAREEERALERMLSDVLWLDASKGLPSRADGASGTGDRRDETGDREEEEDGETYEIEF